MARAFAGNSVRNSRTNAVWQTPLGDETSGNRSKWANRLSFRSPAFIGVLSAIAALILLTPLLARMEGGPSWLFVVGTDRPPPAVAGEHPPYQHPGGGYDAQFYLYAAYDPLLLHPAAPASFDFPAVRFQRIGLPLLAWLFALGKAGLVPWTYLSLEIVLTGVLGWALATLARGWGRNAA